MSSPAGPSARGKKRQKKHVEPRLRPHQLKKANEKQEVEKLEQTAMGFVSDIVNKTEYASSLS